MIYWLEWTVCNPLLAICLLSLTYVVWLAESGCANYQQDIRKHYHIGRITSVQHGDRIDFYEDGKWFDVWKPE